MEPVLWRGGHEEVCPAEGKGGPAESGERTKHHTTHNSTQQHTHHTLMSFFLSRVFVFFVRLRFFLSRQQVAYFVPFLFFLSVCVFFVPTTGCLFCPVFVFFCPATGNLPFENED